MDKKETKTIHFRVWCQAYYNSELEIPADMTKEEAFDYIQEHLEDVPIDELEYLPDSDNMEYEDYMESDSTWIEDNKPVTM